MWGVIVLLVVGLFQLFQNPKNTKVSGNMAFSNFLKNVEDGRVVQVEIKGNNIEGILSDGTVFNTYAPNDPNLVEKLTSKGVSITASPIDDKMPSLLGVLLSWFPMLLLIGVWVFFMRQMQGGKGGAMGFGKSKAKLLSESRGKVTFNDVAGIDEAKEEVEEIVEFLKNPRKFRRLGGKIPKGALLIDNPVSSAPGFIVKNVYVLPGVPKILQAMFNGLEDKIKGVTNIISKNIIVHSPEGEIADFLELIQNDYKNVSIGSYPYFRPPDVGTNVVLRSINKNLINEAFIAICAKLKEYKIQFEDT